MSPLSEMSLANIFSQSVESFSQHCLSQSRKFLFEGSPAIDLLSVSKKSSLCPVLFSFSSGLYPRVLGWIVHLLGVSFCVHSPFSHVVSSCSSSVLWKVLCFLLCPLSEMSRRGSCGSSCGCSAPLLCFSSMGLT